MDERPSGPMIVVAACALVDAAGLVLLTRRPTGKPLAGLWEFPGGKVEWGEDAEDAAIREFREELGIDIARADLAPLTFASYSYADFHLLMPVFLCRRWRSEVAPLEGQEIAWVEPDRLGQYEMPPADEPLKTSLAPLLRALGGRGGKEDD